ncbi:DNA topoisomerase IV subunit A [Candidatus Clostridium radicumherbarum]|uniref:DNA topoisomerase (ATP-hydrolyzing) n=1 Tax=Candidatus Clostridium radicumherbarum TaxID=3381662 RepID=A0ABW8TWK8_9CLOT
MAKKNDIPKDNNIIKIPLEEAMPDNYLPYAVEVAKDRALPDVRDGLKPVHRRILYGAYSLRAYPDKPYFKSARIVGDILGKYHPHGDSSVYESMVILAQDFSTRMPLIDGHGNWGSQDGDSAAAMRYTEARLTPLAMEMLRDIDKDIVDMEENYSNTELEPKVLPSRYPNLLVNGAFGIAVGLATNIPPHNLNEVIDGTLAYIENNEITTSELLKFIKGPDLPTGGIIIGKNSLKTAYETGEGKVTLRAKTKVEKLESGKLGIVITEFPYRKSKAKLLQTISEMTEDKKHTKALEGIIDIRDESDRNGIRAVIELKKSVDAEAAEKLLKYLFKKTDLQSNISFNMVALANGKPETLGLKAILMHYVNHQKEVITRRTKKELQIAEKRFHIVEGFIKAIGILDEIIALIRASKSKKDAENNLMKTFDFTELQAEAIVELMLYRLTGLEIITFEKEYKELEKQIKALKKILESEKELHKVIKKELLEIKERYGNGRKTTIIEDDEEAKIDVEELIIVEDTIITLSKDGFIKRIPLKSYNRSNLDAADIEYREGDSINLVFESNTTDVVIFFTDKGNMYQLKGNAIPEFKWKDKGVRLDQIIKAIDLSKEKLLTAYSLNNFSNDKELIFITNKGNIKKTSLDKFTTNYSKLQAIKLKDTELLVNISLMTKERQEEFIKVTTMQGLGFTIKEPKLENLDRNLSAQALISLPINDEISTARLSDEGEFKEFFLTISSEGVIRSSDHNHTNSKKDKRIFTNSQEKLLIFLSNGNVLNLSSALFANVGEEGISLNTLFGEALSKQTKILNIINYENSFENLSIIFISKKGLVKKTKLEEFVGDYQITQGYKFKSSEDSLIAIDFISEEMSNEILIVTQKAFAIKIGSEDIPFMGKLASGVIGISLKDEDEVIFAAHGQIKFSNSDEIALSSLKDKEIILISNKKNKKNVKLSELRRQNRAGRGVSLMLVIFDEFVKEVKLI